jgi:ketosteroid isomerase-like protein
MTPTANDSRTAATRAAVETYFSAWQARDFERFRAVLADDVTFAGPLGTADDAERCVQGIKGLSQSVTAIDVRQVVVDGADAVTLFDLHTDGAEPVFTANWSHVEDGLITRIRVIFDPRPLLG